MVRKYKSEDQSQVMELWLTCNIMCHSFIPSKYWQNNYTEVSRILELSTVYVYEAKGEIVGFMGAMDDFMVTACVKEEFRGMGIGNMLLTKILADRETMSATVYEKNEKALKFFVREDFVEQSRSQNAATGETEVLLSWKR